jgi:O-acetyl-ADP-ribose deacetylase (regulator of RNase III)
MDNIKEIQGNLITMALNGEFDLIGHGANCFCRMGSGIAKEIAERIPDAVAADNKTIESDIRKLGNFTMGQIDLEHPEKGIILNIYTQYNYGTDKINVDYEAITLALRKINHVFKGKHIGLPLIGAGKARGKWSIIKKIIYAELVDMQVSIVHFEE